MCTGHRAAVQRTVDGGQITCGHACHACGGVGVHARCGGRCGVVLCRVANCIQCGRDRIGHSLKLGQCVHPAARVVGRLDGGLNGSQVVCGDIGETQKNQLRQCWRGACARSADDGLGCVGQGLYFRRSVYSSDCFPINHAVQQGQCAAGGRIGDANVGELSRRQSRGGVAQGAICTGQNGFVVVDEGLDLGRGVCLAAIYRNAVECAVDRCDVVDSHAG